MEQRVSEGHSHWSVLLNHLTPVSIWAMNFAMMFALALGIDYALFLVVRFRAALARHGGVLEAAAETMDTAGKAVALSGATVLVSLSAVMLVPVPAFRSMAAGGGVELDQRLGDRVGQQHQERQPSAASRRR